MGHDPLENLKHTLARVNACIVRLAPTKRSNVWLMQVHRHTDSPDAQVNQFYKN